MGSMPRQGGDAADAQYPPFWTACSLSVDIVVELGNASELASSGFG